MPNRLYHKESLEASIKNGQPAPDDLSELRPDEVEIFESIFSIVKRATGQVHSTSRLCSRR
jgi:hypothetical protein